MQVDGESRAKFDRSSGRKAHRREVSVVLHRRRTHTPSERLSSFLRYVVLPPTSLPLHQSLRLQTASVDRDRDASSSVIQRPRQLPVRVVAVMRNSHDSVLAWPKRTILDVDAGETVDPRSRKSRSTRELLVPTSHSAIGDSFFSFLVAEESRKSEDEERRMLREARKLRASGRSREARLESEVRVGFEGGTERYWDLQFPRSEDERDGQETATGERRSMRKRRRAVPAESFELSTEP